MARLFLGLDCSTQSLSALLIDYDEKKVVYEKQLIFEEKFPHYQTKSGVLREGNSVYSLPLMWVEALDRLFCEMQKEGVPLDQVLAISGAAQQHGSVYLNDSFPEALDTLRLENALSRETAPIWMDASTTVECEEIREGMGGLLRVIEATGSNTFERFTGPQIRKFYKTEEKAYRQTKTIALVSSFLASLLAGKVAPIDYGDGSGMNLMDIRAKKWDPRALDVTAPGLEAKLPPLAPSSHVIGTVNPYFYKYGLNPEALALVWTGDNPSSLIGLGLTDEETVGVSLGTSFTYFGGGKEFHIDPKGEGHLFVSPTGDYMMLNCFLNGALAIEKVRKRYRLDWNAFYRHLAKTPPGNNGAIMLPYFDAEIVPKVLQPGVRRFHLKEEDISANCRALIEAQMMSMRVHADWMGLSPKQIYATGGIARHIPILQILADVHERKVLTSEVHKSTALGAALRGAFAYFGNKSWGEIVAGFTDSIPVAEPNLAVAPIYARLAQEYRDRESDNR